MIHSFVATVTGADLTSLDGRDADALYEAGCDDALLASDSGVQQVTFDREAPSFADAVRSAVAAIETAIPGARVTAIQRMDSTDEQPPQPGDDAVLTAEEQELLRAYRNALRRALAERNRNERRGA